MLKIDMHAHMLPESWPDLADKYGDDRFAVMRKEGKRHLIHKDGRFFREVWPNAFDPEVRIAEYAEHGVQVQVVSTVPVLFSYWAPGESALELARYLNDHIAGVAQEHPKNIIPLATVPLQAPDLAIAEMERCKTELNIPGIQIGSHVNEWNLSDDVLFGLFEAAQDLDVAIMVHPWDMMGKETMPKYWLPWLVGMPAEQSRAICSMIFGGVFERLPKLRVLFAHGGGSFPYTLGRIEHGFNMRPDLVAVDNKKGPRDYLGHFYVDSITHDPAALRYLIDIVGLDAIAMGTDYPFPLGEQKPGAVLDALGLSEVERERVFHGTALEWLGLDKAQFEN